MNALFSRIAGSLALTVTIFIAGNLSAQTTVDYRVNTGAVTLTTGQTGNNYATINRGTVNGGRLNNQSTGTVNTLTLNSGTVSNAGTIGGATINGGGLSNYDKIEYATVVQGSLTNVGSSGSSLPNNRSQIENLVVLDGIVDNKNWINNVTVDGGTINNWDWNINGNSARGLIENLTLNGGTVHNGDGTNGYRYIGIINNATVNDGYIRNQQMYGRIDNLTLNGGTVDGHGWQILNGQGGTVNAVVNGGTLNGGARNLTVNGGTVNGGADTMIYNSGTVNGGANTLTLAGNSGNNTGNWGQVTNLAFVDNGSGILSVSAFADDTTPGFYSGVRATNANFNYGNVSLNLSGIDGMFGENYWADTFFEAFGGTTGFLLGDLVGAASNRVSGVAGLQSLEVVWGDYAFWILNNGVLADGWNIASQNGFVSWDGMTFGAIEWRGSNADVPEPATLAVIGLGLAGLGIARRRMKK